MGAKQAAGQANLKKREKTNGISRAKTGGGWANLRKNENINE